MMQETLKNVSGHALTDESEAVAALLGEVTFFRERQAAIQGRAKRLVMAMRKKDNRHSVTAFLKEYGIDTREGIAIMCLAEALLRIPDGRTADSLIRDKLRGTEWDKHLKADGSLFVNAATWGMMLTGSVVGLRKEEESSAGAVLGRLVNRLGEPVIREAIRRAMRIVGGQFVMGETIGEAMKEAESWKGKGWRYSYDLLGEGARTDAQAQAYYEGYLAAVKEIGAASPSPQAEGWVARPSVSVKLSALHPRYALLQRERVMTELVPRAQAIVRAAKEAGIAVCIDAEEADRLDLSLEVFIALYQDEQLAGYDGLGLAVQAYQKRAPHVIDALAALAERGGRRIPVRLVKGAYWDAEIKHAQVEGLPGYPVFTRKEATDVSYLACADKLLKGTGSAFYPQFATHNAMTVAAIMEAAQQYGVTDYEFQRLYGMGAELYEELLDEVPCRVYAPVGVYKDLLAYLIRRLMENGANTSFVHLLIDEETPLDELLKDPIATAEVTHTTPDPRIPLPESLYGKKRANSQGRDLGNAEVVAELRSTLQALHEKSIVTPGEIEESDVDAMVVNAVDAFPVWEKTGVKTRATILINLADILESDMEAAISLMMREGGKTLHDAIAEVREAADFCRYYACHAEHLFEPYVLPGPTGETNTLTLHGRGPFVCISPWNFPLAIFTGQVAAALAAGNTVLAKPAEQTPAIAAWAVAQCHAAGVPHKALQLVHGPGRTVGAKLIAHPAIAGVAFTGSTQTARHIHRTLANKDGPIVPLIAETGGQNAMIVDSSALPEQATDDIVLSAFGSAGQRCSALRVLYVQEEVAEDLIAMLKGAMAELHVGDPCDFATDIGPVIDVAAQESLLAHIEMMKRNHGAIYQTPCSPKVAGQSFCFVPPTLIEIPDISVLAGENFGPVLHLVRYKASELGHVIEAINGTGFGLTLGVHSRIAHRWERITAGVKAGNQYVNRSMTGAVVGVQPFGGEGLSGTGPKAGGPHYLLRFVTERTRTVNTAAIGGNLELLS